MWEALMLPVSCNNWRLLSCTHEAAPSVVPVLNVLLYGFAILCPQYWQFVGELCRVYQLTRLSKRFVRLTSGVVHSVGMDREVSTTPAKADDFVRQLQTHLSRVFCNVA